MRKMKRMIALVTVALFIFSFAAPAMAKTNAEAVDRLNALGIIIGYEDGSFKPEQNITRAEYAAIVVQALGLGKAAEYVKGNTKFSDVKADHWASGVINIAVDQKILAGYPDGSFKPGQNVTYNEAITMVVRMLGYYEAIKNPVYPTSFIAKAAELKLLDNMTITDYSAPATRGNVFMLADDALDTNMWGLKETNDKGEQTYGKLGTLLLEKQKVTEYKNFRLDGVSVAKSAIENKQVILKDNDGIAPDKSGTYDVKGNQGAFFKFFAQKIKAYINDKDEVISIKSDETTVFTDKIKSTSDPYLYFYNNDRKEVAGAAEVFTNYDPASAAAVIDTNVSKGDLATFICDGTGKITKIIKVTNNDIGIVESASDKKVIFNNDTQNAPSDINVTNVDSKYVQVFRNGVTAKMEDIKAGDVISYYKDGSSHILAFATDAKVTGKLSTASASAVGADYFYKLVVGDKTVYSPVDQLQYSTDGGKTWDLVDTIDALNDKLVGQDVTVNLDSNGEAVYIQSGVAGANTNRLDVYIRSLAKKSDAASNTSSTVGYVKVTKADGTMASYEVDNDKYTFNQINLSDQYCDVDIDDTNGTVASDVVPDSFATISLNSAGKVTKIEPAAAANVTTAVTGADEDNKLIIGTVNGVVGKNLVVQDNTTFLNVDKYANDGADNYVDKTIKTSWSAVKSDLQDDVAVNDRDGVATTLQAVTKVWVDGVKVKFVFMDTNYTISSDLKWGVLFGGKFGIGSGDYAVKVWNTGDNEAKQYTLDSSVGALSADNVYTYKVADGKLKEMTKINADVTDIVVDKVQTISGNIVITEWIDANTNGVRDANELFDYMAKANTVKYFDVSSGTMKTLDKVTKGDIISVYDFLNKDGNIKTPLDGMYDVIIKTDVVN